MTNKHAPGHLWNAQHTLDQVDITVRFERGPGGSEQDLRAIGRSETKRTSLWTYLEAFQPETAAEKGYSLADAVHHILLVCEQDRPSSLDRLDFALRGGLSYSQEQLW